MLAKFSLPSPTLILVACSVVSRTLAERGWARCMSSQRYFRRDHGSRWHKELPEAGQLCLSVCFVAVPTSSTCSPSPTGPDCARTTTTSSACITELKRLGSGSPSCAFAATRVLRAPLFVTALRSKDYCGLRSIWQFNYPDLIATPWPKQFLLVRAASN